jgi:methylase of polypeptide subunit release factors
VFTPENYVIKLLDSVGYRGHLYGKKILENSCGDGNILVAVVQRYIDDCVTNGLSRTCIKNGLERDIYGVEIDPEQYEKCINNLNKVLQKNNINSVEWKIFNTDYLRWDFALQFQFVVGNPPYITYSELSKDEQRYVKENFETCVKGKFDYCYAFIEKSIKSLACDGKMAYLIPSSIFKTVFGKKLRDYIKSYLKEIRDYTQDKMFDDALVKSAIMVLEIGNQDEVFQYYNMGNNDKNSIPINSLKEKWFFTTNNWVGTERFGDYFQVSHVVATLLNEAYVIKKENYQDIEGFYLCNGKRIEKEVVRETATPRTKRYKKEEVIIFPYRYEDGKLIRYTETEFKNRFPGANAYLTDFRDQLDERESDKNALWFEYGRTQALAGLNRKKLLISTVITDKVAVYMLKKKCIPYAGMYIVPKRGNRTYSLDDAKAILESDEFMKYVERVGIHISGTSLRITSKDIEEFKF